LTPFYFGDSKTPLFGALSEPPVSNQRDHGVLLCPPIFQEHVRTHWGLRQLATALAREGFHVLRFDWYGVGDSGGNLEDTGFEQLVEDAETAAQELRDTTGIRKVSVVGLRLGEALAALASSRIEPHSLILWDPIVNGAAYWTSLTKLHEEILKDTLRFWYAWPTPARDLLARIRPEVAQRRVSTASERVGFDVPERLRRDIEKLAAKQLIPTRKKTKLSLVVSRDNPSPGELVSALDGASVTYEKRTADVDAGWDDPSKVEELFLPGESAKVILSLLSGGGSA